MVYFIIFVEMKKKSDHTKEFILHKVAPIFNKKGYTATSLSDLIEATKLTKGALYGNFKSKEDMAIKSFKYNVNRVLSAISRELNKSKNSVDKLFSLTNFYREYYDFVIEYGGCPILNVATDTNNVNSKLFQIVNEVAKKTENNLTILIQKGIDNHEIKLGTNSNVVAKNIYSMIEGSIFMSFIHKDKIYISEMMNHIDFIISEKLTSN